MTRSISALLALALAATCGAQSTPRRTARDHRFAVETRELHSEHKTERPLGGRVAVVVVHGYGEIYKGTPGSFKSTFTWSGLGGALADARKADPTATDSMKVHFYYYTPEKPFPVLAAEFADRLVARLLTGPDAAQKVIFVAHSAGTLMSRYAAADPRIQPRVAGILTLAGIHRGSVQASLIAAHHLDERPGVTRAHLRVLEKLRKESGVDPRVAHPDPAQRIACSDDPACAVIESIAFDNFDGSLTEEDASKYGMIANTKLAAFNETDPNITRIHAYHGNVSNFGTELEGGLFGGFGRGRKAPPRRQVPTANEAERQAIAAINPQWANADPLVTFESGTFQGARCELGECRTYDNVDHKGILWNKTVQKQLVADLIQLSDLAQRDQADEFFQMLRGVYDQAIEITQKITEQTRTRGLFGVGGE